MINHQIAQIFEEIGTFLEIIGEEKDKQRAHAYHRAAKSIEGLQLDLKELAEKKQLDEIPNVGKSLAAKIQEFLNTGKITLHEELKQQVPIELLELLNIPGVGPGTARILWKELGITNLQELEYAINENLLTRVKEIGKKRQEKIKEGLAFIKQSLGKCLLSEAVELSLEIQEHLQKCQHIIRGSVAGQLRRKCEEIDTISIIVSPKNIPATLDYFSRLPIVSEIISTQPTSIVVKTYKGLKAELIVTSDEDFFHALYLYTGSQAHISKLQPILLNRGIKLQDGRFIKNDKPLTLQSEEQLFAEIGLQYIPPELREDFGEIEAAVEWKLPTLVEDTDLLGIIHVHTNWSDGVNSIEDLAEATKKMGYKYIGIADHSKAAYYANGLDEEHLLQQIKHIDEINASSTDFKILKGIETDILPDGRLDLSDEVLEKMDFVIASVHSHFAQPEDVMTERIIKALKNPHVDILGHPSGRLILGRAPYKVNIEKILTAAKDLGKAIELNCYPQRLDLDWRYLIQARRMNIPISINPDSHNIHGLEDIKYGVAIARKGWLSKENIINTLSANKVIEMFARRK